ncbi:MAG: AAA family ATPase [Bacillota bacterium]
MYIERLAVRDFGILYNQNLEDLNSGLVVIGGLNRAGKSTTLKLLRYLGYGFPRDNSIPQARNKYSLEADYYYQAQKYNLSLTGYSEPQINNLSGGAANNVYDNLDSYTYQQLFTISLKKLYQIPNNDQEQRKLQSILLGAGLTDLLEIEQLKDDLRSEAEAIGGKVGNPSVYQFKKYNNQIKSGLKLREEAKTQLKEYKILQSNLKEIKEQQDIQEKEITMLQSKLRILDLLKNNYQLWQEKQSIELELATYDYNVKTEKYSQSALKEAVDLKQNFLSLKEKIEKKRSRFRDLTNSSKINLLRDKLISHKEKLKNINLQLSGLKERINNYQLHKKELRTKEKKIKKQLKEECEEWQSFSALDKIKVDAIKQDQLEQLIQEYQELKQHYEKKEEKIFDLKEEKQRVETELNSLEETKLEGKLKKYYSWALGFVIVGIMAFVLDLWLGMLLAVVGIIGAGINYISSYVLNNTQLVQGRNLEAKLTSLSKQIKNKRSNLKQLNQKKSSLEAELNSYRKQLKLPSAASIRLIKSRFNKIKKFKSEIEEWLIDKQDLKKQKRKLTLEIQEILDLITKFPKQNMLIDISDSKLDLIQNSEKIIATYQKIYSYLDLALKITTLRQEHQKTKEEIEQLLNKELEPGHILDNLNDFISACQDYAAFIKLKTDLKQLTAQLRSRFNSERIKNKLKNAKWLKNEQKILEIIAALFSNYSSISELKEQYQNIEQQLKESQNDLKKLTEEKLAIEGKKEELASDDKLKSAQQKIKQGRSALEPLAEKYAVRKAAAFILDKVQQEFIAKVQNKMLAPAGDILAKITNNAYQQILPQEDLSKVDFKLESENKLVETACDLSRGTLEQLFLAVRISRIKEIEPKLPVVLDDSLVNFDLFHQQQAVNLLLDLAKTNQTFILTCHPQLIKLIKSQSSSTQYWQLEKGRFELTTAQQLINHLSANS